MESIDVYDINRSFTGKQIDRQLEKLKPDQYMLYALALIENQDHKYLLTRRSMNKNGLPAPGKFPEVELTREKAQKQPC